MHKIGLGLFIVCLVLVALWGLSFLDNKEAPLVPKAPSSRKAPVVPNETINALKAECVALGDELVNDFPEDPKAIGLAGNIQNRLGRHEEAEKLWGKAIAMTPNDHHGHDALAMAAFVREDYKTAEMHWRKALALHPSLRRGAYNLAQALMLQGRIDDAIKVMETDKADREKTGAEYYLLGQLYSQRQAHEKAREQHEAAIRLEGRVAKYHYALAQACLKLGDKVEAKKCLATFKALKQNDIQADKTRRSAYDDLDSIRKDFAGLFLPAGEFYANRRKMDRAEALWKRSAALDPAQRHARSNLARLCQMSGRLEEAAAWHEAVDGIAPRDPINLYNLGILQARMNQFEKAAATFQAVTTLAPKRPEGYWMQALMLVEQGKHIDEAVLLAARAVALDPNNPKYRSTLMQLRERMKGGRE